MLHGICLISVAESLPLGFNDFKEQKNEDKVHVYANQLLSLGCFYIVMPLEREMVCVCFIVGRTYYLCL